MEDFEKKLAEYNGQAVSSEENSEDAMLCCVSMDCNECLGQCCCCCRT